MSKQSSSDPLPYVQIDRAAEPTFALLAGKLKVSHQHAIGSLYEFWKLCGDPRELEAVVAATAPDAEPELVLTAEDVALRFELASGVLVEPIVLARLGILEQREEKSFRVRGMSRSFEPIVKRVRAREVAALGGKASAESRKKSTGSAQPVGGKGSKPRSDGSSVEGVAESNRLPKQNGTDDRSETEPTTEAEPKPSGQRSAVSDIRGSMSSAFQAHRAGEPIEDENTLWGQAADSFIAWAREQAPELYDAGPGARDWAQDFFVKYQPSQPELIRAAFAKFLLWCHRDGKQVGWGLWLEPAVWEPRWAEVRAEAQARGAA